jgi:hypothetical protein
MCLSGDVHALSHASWSLVLRAIASYRALAATIAEGTFRRYGPEQTFLRRPAGWQAVICHAPSRREAFMVWHAFADAPERVAMPLPQDCIWSGARELLGAPIQVEITNHELVLRLPGPWTGGVLHLDVSGSP